MTLWTVSAVKSSKFINQEAINIAPQQQYDAYREQYCTYAVLLCCYNMRNVNKWYIFFMYDKFRGMTDSVIYLHVSWSNLCNEFILFSFITQYSLDSVFLLIMHNIITIAYIMHPPASIKQHLTAMGYSTENRNNSIKKRKRQVIRRKIPPHKIITPATIITRYQF
jgi:hypothetical protein